MLGNIREFRTNHRRIFGFLFVLVFIIVGLAAHAGYDKANASCSFSNPNGHCFGPKQMAHKFRAGEFKHAHGFTPAVKFKHPVKARKYITHVIKLRLNKSSAATIRQVRSVVAPKSHGKGGFGFLCDNQCLAEREYNRLQNKSSCIGDDLFHVGFGTNICTKNNHHPITMHGVQQGLGIGLCAGSVVAGIVAAAPTAGTATMTALGFAGASCGWSLWVALDPE